MARTNNIERKIKRINIIQMLKDGKKSTRKIAETLHCSLSTIAKIKKEMELKSEKEIQIQECSEAIKSDKVFISFSSLGLKRKEIKRD